MASCDDLAPVMALCSDIYTLVVDGLVVKTKKSWINWWLIQTSPNLYDCLNWAQLLFVVSHWLPSEHRRGAAFLPIGPLPPPHFLLDLTSRHPPVANYHSVSCSSCSGVHPPQQHFYLAMNHITNCPITSTIMWRRTKKKRKKTIKVERTDLTC